MCDLPIEKMVINDLVIIQNRCIKDGSITKDERLMEIIQSDKDSIKKMAITCEQIFDVLDKVRLHFNYGGYENEIITDEDKKNAFNIRFDDTWKCEEIVKKNIFNNVLQVTRVKWDRQSICPFSNKSGEYLPYDWILYKVNSGEWFWFSDCLPHQIQKHRFFQGHNSKYRVDPIKLINFFSITPLFLYHTKCYEKNMWKLVSDAIYSKQTFDNLISANTIVDKCETEDYSAYKLNNGTISNETSIIILVVRSGRYGYIELFGAGVLSNKKIFEPGMQYIYNGTYSYKYLSDNELKYNWL